jgi:hypothetical protein
MLCLKFRSEECTCLEAEFLEEDKLDEKTFRKIVENRPRKGSKASV